MKAKNLICYLFFIVTLTCLTGLIGAITNDSSKLNSTEVKQVILLDPSFLVSQLRSALKAASEAQVSISMKGSQHSQGGHTFYPGGILLDFQKCNQIKQISETTIRVQCGATWKDVLNYLNPKGLSVRIMQSDFDFSIAGTVSANVHGWQLNTPPIIETIEGFHIMLANGNVIYCSRASYPDLFAGVIGGYGLLGIILDIDLRIVPNKVYTLKHWTETPNSFPTLYNSFISDPNARMFFGRFSLDRDNFLKHISIIVYNETDEHLSEKPLSEFFILQCFTNWLFQKTYDNNFARKIRWYLEKSSIIKHFIKKLTRNQLLYHSVNHYISQDVDTVDLLQEYFIPAENFNKFVAILQKLQPKLEPHLMNITLRQVSQDTQSLLSYASNDRLCFVMFFHGPKTKEFDDTLKSISQTLTSYALDLKGTYYLPYRPYQTKEQFHQAYPNYQKFQSLKSKYDPKKLFKNKFYEFYLN